MPTPTAGDQPHRHHIMVLAGRFAVCRLDAGSPIPAWAWQGDFSSVTRTSDEVSVVCPAAVVPESVRAERGWRVLRVVGIQDLGLVGVLASLAGPIAEAGVSLFVLATFDTDYLLVREANLGAAVEALAVAGHQVTGV